MIDNKLVELHEGRYEGAMKVKMTGINIWESNLPIETIFKKLKIETGTGYMPRAVAFNVDQFGNWVFSYALREQEGSDEITCNLFCDLLNKTNFARAEAEKLLISANTANVQK